MNIVYRPYVLYNYTPTRFAISPNGTQAVSPADRSIVAEHGLAVVDCSWARLEDVPFKKLKTFHDRLRMYFIIKIIDSL